MNNKTWKSTTRTDTTLAVLLLAFTLVTLGVGAWSEYAPQAETQAAASAAHHA